MKLKLVNQFFSHLTWLLQNALVIYVQEKNARSIFVCVLYENSLTM